MKKLLAWATSRATIWVVLFAGSLLSYLGYDIARNFEDDTIQLEQERLTQLARDVLLSELRVDIARLNSIRGLFLASTHVSRDEFTRFVMSELEGQHSIQAMEWIPLVTEAQRENHIDLARQDGFVDFDIWQQNPVGEKISVNKRAKYFPIFYVEPLEGNEAALGFDLASDESRRIALAMARKTRQSQATVSITLLQETTQQKGFLVVQPVFKHVNNRDNELKEAPLIGYTLGVFKIGDLFTDAIAPIKDQLTTLTFELTDITDPARPDVLLRSETFTQAITSSNGKWQQNQPINFTGRQWTLTTKATPEFIASFQSSTPWLFLLTGLVFTLTVSAYLRTLLQRELKVRALVKHRTAELQSSAQLNRTIVENAVDAVITIDIKGAVSRFNPAAVRMFGYEEAEVVGQNVKMLMPNPYHSEHDDYLSHYKQTGEKRIIGIGREVKGQRKDGSTFPMNLSVGEAADNGNTIYVGTITDLTVLKIREQELRDFTNRLELATKAGGIGVWVYDIDKDILQWDERMFELYGIKRDQFSGPYEAWKNAFHNDDLEQAEATFKKIAAEGKPFETEYRIIWPDGQTHYIQAFGEVMLDEKERRNRMIGVNQDITQRKLTERAMGQAKKAAEEANRQKSAFLNIMSHELRTPLTVILGYLPILRDQQKMPPPETIKQIAEDMNISGQHLLALINDLLDISKIEAGQMNLSIETVESLPLTQDMLRKFNNQANQKGIELINKTSNFSFLADERRLRQILINLISNALKFTEHGSIEVSAKQVKQTVVFTIKDTGIGIVESELPFIFDTFHQVDDTSTRNVGGSGLGLAISKRLVELHGGTIHVESKPGSGTTFTFSLEQ